MRSARDEYAGAHERQRDLRDWRLCVYWRQPVYDRLRHRTLRFSRRRCRPAVRFDPEDPGAAKRYPAIPLPRLSACKQGTLPCRFRGRAKEIEQAREFVSSARGQLILGQALAIASRELRTKEPSNASDMAYIGKTLFSVFYHIYNDEYQEIMKKAQEEANKLNQQST